MTKHKPSARAEREAAARTIADLQMQLAGKTAMLKDEHRTTDLNIVRMFCNSMDLCLLPDDVVVTGARLIEMGRIDTYVTTVGAQRALVAGLRRLLPEIAR